MRIKYEKEETVIEDGMQEKKYTEKARKSDADYEHICYNESVEELPCIRRRIK